MRESILNGALPPGESLSQVQLANQLGVSRGPLREAVRMLQREGLVEAEVNRRGRVSSFSIDDLEQLYAMRIVHESLAIRINVPRFTKRDIDALRGCLRRMEALAGHDVRQWQGVDREFHFTLLAHAGDRLMRTIRELYDHASDPREFTNLAKADDSAHRATMLQLHEQIEKLKASATPPSDPAGAPKQAAKKKKK